MTQKPNKERHVNQKRTKKTNSDFTADRETNDVNQRPDEA